MTSLIRKSIITLLTFIFLYGCVNQEVSGERKVCSCQKHQGYDFAICINEVGKDDESIILLNALESKGDKRAKHFLNIYPELKIYSNKEDGNSVIK